jgi:hypothetical protein
MIGPNTALRDAVLAALRDHLGRYKNPDGTDRGLAFSSISKSFSLVSEGLPPGTTASGLECVFALLPDPDFTARYETGDAGGIVGILYHACVLKGWDGSVMPAYEALTLAFPMISLSSHRRPRYTPGGGDYIETLTAWVPMPS